MDSQTVGFNANSTMDDLECAIMQDSALTDAATDYAITSLKIRKSTYLVFLFLRDISGQF